MTNSRYTGKTNVRGQLEWLQDKMAEEGMLLIGAALRRRGAGGGCHRNAPFVFIVDRESVLVILFEFLAVSICLATVDVFDGEFRTSCALIGDIIG